MATQIKTANRQGIAIKDFARREGVSDTLVHQAIKNGRLKAYPDRSLDPALVGTPWRMRNATATGEGSAATATDRKGGLAYSEALRVKENYLAMLRRLEYEEKSGAVIELTVAEAVLFERARSQRDSWLNWPTRIGPLLAADLNVEIDLVTNALTAYVHQHIAELGEPEADFNRSQG
ncbi:hypothetical protein [Paraburkholderia sp. BR14320]|uniref:hypothetical protein n=1 Tax=unclassified Paraburkholderia TaxID=2615204 RepID=UPI0034CF33CD